MAEPEVEVKDAPVENEPEVAKTEETKPEEAPAEVPQEEPTIRAIVLTGYGGYSKLKVEKRTKPKVTEGHVIVKVHACGQSFGDLMMRQGMVPYFHKPPVVMGFECSGVVEEVAENVSGLQVGDRVSCFLHSGAFAEYVSAPANMCFKIPESMSFEDAAAFLIPYLTAYFLLFYCGNVTRRKTVLIHNASGSVGMALIQLCKTVKGLTIFGTASLAKHEAIKDLGVDHAIDYRTQDYVEEIKKITPTIDLVLDPLGGHDTKKCYDLLSPLGALVVYGWSNNISESKSLFAGLKSWFGGVTFNPLKMINDSRTVSGMDLVFVNPELLHEAMDELLQLYLEGTLKMPIDSTYAFEEIAQAHQRMHDRANIGKILLSPFKEPDPAAEPVKKRKKSFSKFHTEKPKNGKEDKAKEEAQDSDEKPAETDKEGEEAGAEVTEEDEKKDQEKEEDEKKEDTKEKKEEETKEEKKDEEKKEEEKKDEEKKEEEKKEEKAENKKEEEQKSEEKVEVAVTNVTVKEEEVKQEEEKKVEETKEEARKEEVATEELKDEPKPEVTAEPEVEVKDESKEETKEESKEDTKQEANSEEQQEEKETKEEPKDNADGEPKEEAKEGEKKEESEETKKGDDSEENTEM